MRRPSVWQRTAAAAATGPPKALPHPARRRPSGSRHLPICHLSPWLVLLPLACAAQAELADARQIPEHVLASPRGHVPISVRHASTTSFVDSLVLGLRGLRSPRAVRSDGDENL